MQLQHGRMALQHYFFFIDGNLFPSQVTKHNFIMEQQDFYILAVALKGS